MPKYKMETVTQENIIEERKKKAITLLKKTNIWAILILVGLIALSIYIRTMPISDHSGRPGLWDITTNTWTLGPDLDPYLFLRQAKTIVEQGSLPKIDEMRNVPLGFDNSADTRMLVPYLIVLIYRITGIFKEISVTYAGVIYPVVMFVLTLLSFFLFVRVLFSREDQESKIKANIIALISSLFLIVIPVFLPRTVAGIPEKESAAFFFLFLCFYLFIKAWKSNKKINSIIFSGLAGISTGLMGIIWGGISYNYITLAVAVLLAFMLNKVHKKEMIPYSTWMFVSFAMLFVFGKIPAINFVSSMDTGLAFLVFVIIIVDMLLWNTKIKEFSLLKKIKLPKNIISLILTILFGIIISSIIFGPGFIIDKIDSINHALFTPVTGRWNTTVAENRQPFFTEWGASFGPFIRGLPLFFWLFFAGSVVLFKNITKGLKNRDSWILTGLYALFFIGVVFSRYASSFPKDDIGKLAYLITIFIGFLLSAALSVVTFIKNKKFKGFLGGYLSFISVLIICLIILAALIFSESNPSLFMNGENSFSKFFYYFTALVFLAHLIWYYKEYGHEEEHYFENFNFEYLLLFALFILCLVTARGAVRLIMVLAPIAPIFVGYLIVESADNFRKEKGETKKIIFAAAILIVLILSIMVFLDYYKTVKAQAYSYIPGYYNQQWQKAMEWVRVNTDKNAVFGHWWDYGYWVQSIGERATVLDGGNVLVYWNYLMGRNVLTGDNQDDSLEFLYNHNATHLLIDSSDIGKYGAFSSIGSNLEFDRYSWIPVVVADDTQNQETRDGETIVYRGGFSLDEDITYNDTESGELLFPQETSGIAGFILYLSTADNKTDIKQPEIVLFNQGKQQKLLLRYIYYNEKFKDFGSGVEGTLSIIPRVDEGGEGISINNLGAAVYISPRVMRGFLAQKYLLNDPFNKFPNFKLAHSEDNLIVESIRARRPETPEFIYFRGLQGPIKIWEINYTGKEKVVPEYLQRRPPASITWKF